MTRPRTSLTIALLLIAGLIPFTIQETSAYDVQVYNNLMKSHDALSAQQAELQKAYDDTQKQIDALNQRLTRLDTYLKQVSSSLKDVDTALLYAKQ